MAGIYIHIPFCRQACHYCNFHFSTSLRNKEKMVEAILTEMELRADYLDDQEIHTIYFGGGTPSLLTESELLRFFDKIQNLWHLTPDAEITLEANPDDLTVEKLMALRNTPVNRLSIGVQSFSEEDLRWMNRAHNAAEASTCIENALKLGFENLTVDLIYGSPTTSDVTWQQNMAILLDYGIPHVSSYCLTVEPGTALHHFVETGKSPSANDEQGARQFEMLIDTLVTNGYDHYEISNFARPGRHSRHNSAYWKGVPYLGLGPSAHSFDGHRSRSWNIAHNIKYLKGLLDIPLKKIPAGLREEEVLTKTQQYNEYVMTSLRTSWGCQLKKIAVINPKFKAHFLAAIRIFLEQQTVEEKSGSYTLTRQGKLLADHIASELFEVED